MGKPGPCLIDFRGRVARTKVTTCNSGRVTFVGARARTKANCLQPAGLVVRESIKQGSLLTEYIGQVELTRRTETSQYPEEQKATAIPRVVASEMGAACTI
jgi:hypothetical protein